MAKHRHPILTGAVKVEKNTILAQTCAEYGWSPKAIEVMPEHAYLFLEASPGEAPSHDSAYSEIDICSTYLYSLFYLFLALSHAISGVLRGSGKAAIPMVIMFSVWCFLRVAYITIALSVSHSIELIYSAYPVTWTISSILFIIYMRKADWLHGLEKR